jgi:hypothetical protein
MPRRPRRAAATTTTQTPPAPPANVITFAIPERSPRATKIKSLLSVKRQATENMNEIKDSLGGTVADAVENHGLHKKAFGWIGQLDKMSPEKIHDTMMHFLYYYEASGLQARAASAPRLPTGDAAPATAVAEAEAEAPPTVPVAGNVRPFPQQAQTA